MDSINIYTPFECILVYLLIVVYNCILTRDVIAMEKKRLKLVDS